MLKDSFNNFVEKKIHIDSDYIEFTSKEDFFKTYRLFSVNETKEEEIDVFEEYSFYPIKNIFTNEINIMTKDKYIKKTLSKLKDKFPLKVLTKYFNSTSSFFLVENAIYFDIVDKNSVLDKEYTDDEAKIFFQDLLTDASRKSASDIHITWLSDSIAIKYRIDGQVILQPKKISRDLGKALRNIFVNKTGESEYEENEIAGQLTEIVDGIKREYRLSIGPTVHGYIIVIRMESTLGEDSNLEQWGYSPKAIELIRKLFNVHYGIILVTGATGSGKSTLLYTSIIEKRNQNKLYSPEILTVEDPVEIVINGVNQVQVNTKGDQENWITFTSAIKMFLRQDPDMIVVGEVRDKDVAMQAVTAAKTGHLTASTLHTNDVKSTFSRLNELGIENANIEDGVKGVISQRLLNKLCNSCKIKRTSNGYEFYDRNPEGCEECKGSTVSGCKGRVPIVEIAELNSLSENYKPENFENYYSIDENIIYLLEEGIIDVKEARRYIIYNEGEDISKRKEILNIWDKAMKGSDLDNYIFPLYQPILDKNDFIIGYDSFMRVKNDKDEILSPEFFLELTKKMNMYNNFSMHILDQLIKDSAKLNKRIFWKIDKENIEDDLFQDSLLKKLKSTDTLNKIVLSLKFTKEYIPFILFCKKNNIKYCFENFKATIEEIILIERNQIAPEFIKTTKSFIHGFSHKEHWLGSYLSLMKLGQTKIIINFIETNLLVKDLRNNFDDIVYGYQGYGIKNPDIIKNM